MKDYLGDSVYVDDEGGEIRIYTDYNGYGAENVIVLENDTIMNLLRFIERAKDVKITVAPKGIGPISEKEGGSTCEGE